MRKLSFSLAIIMVVLVFAGCGKQETNTTTFTTTQELTTESTEVSTQPSSTKEKAKSTTGKVVVHKDYTRISKGELKHLLTSQKWILDYVIDKRRNMLDSQMAYGTATSTITFNNDGSFSCNLGKNGCSGTYNVGAGIITLNITSEISSEKTNSNKTMYAYYRYLVDENQEENDIPEENNDFAIPTEKEAEQYNHTIVFDYGAGENYFISQQ